MERTVLVIDDEAEIRRLLDRYFKSQKFGTLLAEDGESGVRAARAKVPDLIVSDINLPGMSGIEVCQALKRDMATASIPILMITGNDKEGQELICLELGADDYLTKPFDTQLLGAHAKALLRRGPYLGARPGVVEKEGLRLDANAKTVRLGAKDFTNLTPKEFDLLYYLVSGAPTVYKREFLYQKIWDAPPVNEGVLRTVDVHIQRIRSKLGLARKTGIVAVSGSGYKWSDGGSPSKK